jgi:uncharacterized protein YuzE
MTDFIKDWKYSADVNILYTGEYSDAYSRSVTADCIVDLDDDGKIIGLEILLPQDVRWDAK